MVTQERLKEVFEYKDGGLYWKFKKASNIVVGTQAGTVWKNRYRQILLDRKLYLEHRLVFLYHHGYLPKIIDHIDGNGLNNSIGNLREATCAQNLRNSRKGKGNTSGHKGVVWDKDRNKWRVQLNVSGSTKNFGRYEDFELACLVADEARDKYHDEFSSTRRGVNVS